MCKEIKLIDHELWGFQQNLRALAKFDTFASAGRTASNRAKIEFEIIAMNGKNKK